MDQLPTTLNTKFTTVRTMVPATTMRRMIFMATTPIMVRVSTDIVSTIAATIQVTITYTPEEVCLISKLI